MRRIFMNKLTIFVALILVLFSHVSLAVSFDCTKASNFVEKAICSDSLLGKLDDALSENYKGMLDAGNRGDSRKDMKKAQLKWLTARNKCKDNECLIDLYRKQINETCDYGVVSGVHPECMMSEDIK